MKRKASLLFAVTLASGTAAADPIQPTTLPSGAPACGNMATKYKLQTCDAGSSGASLVGSAPTDLARGVAVAVVGVAQRILEAAKQA